MWLTWYIMLTPTVGFTVSPHTRSVVPISPGSGTTLLITGQFGKIKRLFLFPKTLSQGSRKVHRPKAKVEQDGAAPHCPWCFSCTNACLLLLVFLCREDLVLLWLSLAVATYHSQETNVASFGIVFVNIVTQWFLTGHW